MLYTLMPHSSYPLLVPPLELPILQLRRTNMLCSP